MNTIHSDLELRRGFAIRVYDLCGREVASLAVSARSNLLTINWYQADPEPGTYILRIEMQDFALSRRLTLAPKPAPGPLVRTTRSGENEPRRDSPVSRPK